MTSAANLATLSETWTNEVNIEAQQPERLLWDKFASETASGTKQHHFTRLSRLTAQINKGSLENYEIAKVDGDDAPAPIVSVAIQTGIDDFDAVKVNYDARANYTKLIMPALGQGVDAYILSRLQVAVTSPGTAGAPANVAVASLADASWQTIRAAFVTSEFQVKPGMFNAAISPGGELDILGDTNLKNNFWYQNDMIKNGTLPPLYGFQTVTHPNLLVPAASQRRNWFWNINRAKIAKVKDMEMRVDYDFKAGAYLLTARCFFGFAVVDPKGVKYADIND